MDDKPEVIREIEAGNMPVAFGGATRVPKGTVAKRYQCMTCKKVLSRKEYRAHDRSHVRITINRGEG